MQTSQGPMPGLELFHWWRDTKTDTCIFGVRKDPRGPVALSKKQPKLAWWIAVLPFDGPTRYEKLWESSGDRNELPHSSHRCMQQTLHLTFFFGSCFRFLLFLFCFQHPQMKSISRTFLLRLYPFLPFFLGSSRFTSSTRSFRLFHPACAPLTYASRGSGSPRAEGSWPLTSPPLPKLSLPGIALHMWLSVIMMILLILLRLRRLLLCMRWGRERWGSWGSLGLSVFALIGFSGERFVGDSVG